MALERVHGLPRGMLVLDSPDAKTIVDRVIAATRLDGNTLGYLRRMLMITAQDWVRRKA